MKTIKIIDLLNKIANGEEVPKKIKWHNLIYIYNKYNDDSYYEENDTNCMWSGYCFKILNDEVEILDEDEFEDIEEFQSFITNVGRVDNTNIELYIHTLFKQQTQLINNQKKIIKKLNKE